MGGVVARHESPSSRCTSTEVPSGAYCGLLPDTKGPYWGSSNSRIHNTRNPPRSGRASCLMLHVQGVPELPQVSRAKPRRETTAVSVSRIATKLFDHVNLREQTRAFKNTNERQSLSQSSSIELKCDFKFYPQMLRCLTSRKETSDDDFP